MAYKMPDVVILLPGISGSVLKKHDQVVWGYSFGSIAKALFTAGKSMQDALALPHDDPDVMDLGDGIVADALMPDLHLLPGLWKIDGYGKVVEMLKANFEVEEGKNFFPFPYDWRRDNRVAAKKLHRAAQEWLRNWRTSSGNEKAKLILIAHSMGGLVSRYFLECLDGWRDTKALITFGTPYRGSLNALDNLANGLRKGPLDLSQAARQMTAIYQLLPIFECYDSGGGQLARVGEVTGIPNVDATKAAAALQFHREIEAAVTENQKDQTYRTQGYVTYPIVGVVQETNMSGRLVGSQVEMLRTYKGDALGGDGTVPRMSAVPIELSERPTNGVYVGTQHGSLQNAEAVLTHLVGLLSGMQIDLGGFKKPKALVALEIDDVLSADEPVLVRARPTVEGVGVTAQLWAAGQGTPLDAKTMTPAEGGWLRAEFGLRPAATYRVRLIGDEIETAEDAFVVIAAPGNV